MEPAEKPSASGAASPEVTVVIPAYREERRLPASLERLPAAWARAGLPPYEVVVVDDGSDDATADVVRASAARDPRVRLLRHERNRGKGYAVRAGVAAARGTTILVTDADLSTPPEDARALFDALGRGADVAIGSRRAKGSQVLVHQPLHRRVLGAGFALLRRLLVLPGVRDTQCGFKAFRAEAARDVFSRCREDGFVYDVEALWIATCRGWRVVEVPVRWADEPGSQVAPVPTSLSMAAGLLRLARRRLTFWSRP